MDVATLFCRFLLPDIWATRMLVCREIMHLLKPIADAFRVGLAYGAKWKSASRRLVTQARTWLGILFSLSVGRRELTKMPTGQ